MRKRITLGLILYVVVSSVDAAPVALYGVELRDARRDVLDGAVEDAGANRESAPNPHISRFNVEGFGLPGIRRLEILYDGHDRFVQARYKGRIRGDYKDRLVGMLTRKYGDPERKRSGSHFHWSLHWQPSRGVRITLKREHLLGTALFYTDTEAKKQFEAAIQQNEERIVEEKTRTKSGFF